MRIALTALTPKGPADVIVSGDDGATAGQVAEALQESGAEILIVPNGSPYHTRQQALRRDVVTARARETGLPVVYVNRVGGQDELVFDGASFVVNADR